MKRSPPEPGLMQVFRLFTGIQLTLAVISLLASRFSIGRAGLYITEPLAWLNALQNGVLMIYLILPGLPRGLGKWYVPIALVTATLGPMAISAINNVSPGLSIEISLMQLISRQWQLVITLLIPLILVSWQYGLRAVVGYSLGILAVDILLLLSTQPSIYTPILLSSVLTFRTLLYLLIGYSIARLAQGQRKQNADLEQANRQLSGYAATLEQLATTRERSRLAREMHDTLAHSLSGLAVQLEGVRSLWDVQPQAAHELLDQSLSAARQGLTETRRALQSLRASPLEDLGLVLALRGLAETSAGRAGCTLEMVFPNQDPNLPPDVEQGFYRIAQEALENIIHHAAARSIWLALEQQEGQTALIIRDDGSGFDPTQAAGERYGLRGMSERAEMLGGKLEIDSRPEQGSTIRLTWSEPA